jgi:predicted PhzF superfamily epimerase YddE/YHI9
MEIPKDKILDMLRDQGKDDQVAQAEQQLPDQVDPEQHADLLQKFGLDPKDLLGKLGGGIPGL